MDPRPTVGIFVKEARAGHAKTRLIPRLGAAGAASLYTAFLGDTVTLARESGAGVVLFHDGPAPGPELPAGVAAVPQGPGDLGDRLETATGAAERDGRFPLLFLGSDSPDLPASLLGDALEALTRYDVVLGPATDGGVWCIGLQRAHPGFFADLPWSSRETGAALRNRALQLGLNPAALAPWSDVDDPADLDALIQRLTREGTTAPRTLAWLREHGLAT